MKSIVVYTSKTGFTERYAKWISEALDTSIIEISKLSKINLDEYSLIIYGGYICAGRIAKLTKMKKLNKNMIVFAVGARSKDDKVTIENLWNENFTSDEINKIPHFYLEGGLNYEKMRAFDKIIMRLIGKHINMTTSFDKSSNENIEDIIKKAKNIM